MKTLNNIFTNATIIVRDIVGNVIDFNFNGNNGAWDRKLSRVFINKDIMIL